MGRLQTAEQFGAILLKTSASGATVHLRDVARMELGSENYNTVARFNGNAATGVAIEALDVLDL